MITHTAQQQHTVTPSPSEKHQEPLCRETLCSPKSNSPISQENWPIRQFKQFCCSPNSDFQDTSRIVQPEAIMTLNTAIESQASSTYLAKLLSLVAHRNENNEAIIAPNKITLFHEQPNHDWLEMLHSLALRLGRHIRCSESCFAVALIYIDRITENSHDNLSVTCCTVRRLFVTSLLVANQFVDDKPELCLSFSDVSGIPCQVLVACKSDFLFRIGFSLMVSTEQVLQYSNRLNGCFGTVGFIERDLMWPLEAQMSPPISFLPLHKAISQPPQPAVQLRHPPQRHHQHEIICPSVVVQQTVPQQPPHLPGILRVHLPQMPFFHAEVPEDQSHRPVQVPLQQQPCGRIRISTNANMSNMRYQNKQHSNYHDDQFANNNCCDINNNNSSNNNNNNNNNNNTRKRGCVGAAADDNADAPRCKKQVICEFVVS